MKRESGLASALRAGITTLIAGALLAVSPLAALIVAVAGTAWAVVATNPTDRQALAMWLGLGHAETPT